jgi:hypothetical protein
MSHNHHHNLSCLGDLPNGDLYCKVTGASRMTAAERETATEAQLGKSRARLRGPASKKPAKSRATNDKRWSGRFFRSLDSMREMKITHGMRSPRPLSHKAQELASRYIAEEMKTGKYERQQAIAIGISRARRETGEE